MPLPPSALASSNTAALTLLAPATSPMSGILNLESAASVLLSPRVSPGPSMDAKNPTRRCLCSPKTHPGAFRCSFHRSEMAAEKKKNEDVKSVKSVSALDLRRLAMRHSMGRLTGETVGGESVIWPSFYNLRSGAKFQPRPSRLSLMSRAED